MKRHVLLLLFAVALAAGYFRYGVPVVEVVVLIVVALLAIAGGLGYWHFGRTASRVVRAGERARRKHGVASLFDILRYGSAWSVRRKAGIVRPSLAKLSWFGLLRLPTTEVALKLCRAGGVTIWSSLEIAVAVFGGPRRGKTALLANWILDAPGAVFCTSTRLDIKRLTEADRGRKGPLYTFNPAAYGGDEGENGEQPRPEPNTLAFDPLVGCEDMQRATETAEDMIAKGYGDNEDWRRRARAVLAILLHAAALNRDHFTMHTVASWAAMPDESAFQIRAALRDSPQAQALITAFEQFRTTNDRTRSSITNSITPALAWLSCPTAVAALTSGAQLDVPALIRSRATVYLIGRDAQHTEGLTGALTGRIIRDTRLYATRQRGGRCDLSPMVVLDEAARVAKVDLPDISGDAGGNGIILIVAFQSRADMAEVWGPHGAARLITNCGVRILFGGTADADELRDWATLAGERDEEAENFDQSGNSTGHSTRKVPVLATSILAKPGDGLATVFHSDMSPVIGRMPKAWRRPDVRNTLRWRLVGRPVNRWRAGAAPKPAQRPPTVHNPTPSYAQSTK